jgi:hypothetical protein
MLNGASVHVLGSPSGRRRVVALEIELKPVPSQHDTVIMPHPEASGLPPRVAVSVPWVRRRWARAGTPRSASGSVCWLMGAGRRSIVR